MVEKNRNIFQWVTLIGVLVVLFPIIGKGQEFFPLPKPTHLEAGVPRSNLMVVKRIPFDFKEDVFMAEPVMIAVNKSGHMYIFDKKLYKVFILNNKAEYVSQFLESGAGPGEAFPPRTHASPFLDISVGWNGKFYISDGDGDKIIEFTESGRYLRDIKTNRITHTRLPSPPKVDKNGFFYVYSINNGIIDQMDTNMKLVHTYLQRDLNNQYVYYKPTYQNKISHISGSKGGKPVIVDPAIKKSWLDAKTENTFYDLTANGLLLVYLKSPSTVYLFNGKNLIRKFDILVDRVLVDYKKRVDTTIANARKNYPQFVSSLDIPMFLSFIMDYDAPYFYLQTIGDKQVVLYQFDFTGKLVKILPCPKKLVVNLTVKRNGLFYGIAHDSEEEEAYPIILKSEEK